MNPGINPFWLRWLVIVNAGVIVFGMAMVLAPDIIRQLFSLLMYSSGNHVDSFGDAAVDYITLLTGVLGAVMFGWGIALMFTILGPFKQGARFGWNTVAVSIVAWFVPDTLFSLYTGFWQNAVFNLVFVLLFAVPLAATFRAFHPTRKSDR